MKANRISKTRFSMAVVAVALIFSCQNGIAQPGYPPWVRIQPYHPAVRQYPPAQSHQPVYTPYVRARAFQPYIRFGMHFDPLISWFSTNSYDTHNDGVIPGFNFGISSNSYFSPNYAFSSGLNIINSGGRLINNETTQIRLKNFDNGLIVVQPGEAITYRITYLSIPLGFKFQTPRIGYGRFFTDFGFDPKIVLGARADIPSLNIQGGNVLPGLNTFNLSFHIMGGMEYPLTPANNISFGIGYENNLFDTTTDNGSQSWDVVRQKMVSFRIGLTF